MDAPRNVVVERRDSSARTNLEIVVLWVALSSVVVSYFAGFLLGEDSIGGARFDFYEFHWPIIEQFSTLPWSSAAADYPSATNPLLYIIASALPIHNSQKTYHWVSFGIGFLTWPFLSWAYYRRYSNCRINWLWASFGASAILISPGFRSSAFWGTTDYLPFVFCTWTSLLLARFQDLERAGQIGILSLVAVIILSFCAFYTRQFYAFVPVIVVYTVLRRTSASPFIVLGIFFVAALPELYLIHLWRGLNPPTFHGQFHPGMTNVVFTGAIICLLSTPFIAGSIPLRMNDLLPEGWGTRPTVIVCAGLLIFTVGLGATTWPGAGGGIVVKAGLEMGALGTPFILSASYFGLFTAAVFSMRSVTNALLAGSFLLPYFIAFPTYQHYLEPSLVVAVFLFADTPTGRALFNKRVLTCNFVVGVLILAIAIVYYDFFHGLPEPS